MKLIKRILFLTALLYAAGCLVIYFFQEKLIFHPYKLGNEISLEFKLNAQEVEIPVADGIELNGAVFQQKNTLGLMIFWHGNTGDISRYEGHAHEFYRRGWDVLMVDYRSFGKSEGDLSQEHLLADGLAVWDYAQVEYEYAQTMMYGQSLGTGIASYVASERPVDALILESPYYSMERIGTELMPFAPISVLLRFPLPSYSYLSAVNCPILAFHGTDDFTIPYDEHGAALAKLVPSINS